MTILRGEAFETTAQVIPLVSDFDSRSQLVDGLGSGSDERLSCLASDVDRDAGHVDGRGSGRRAEHERSRMPRGLMAAVPGWHFRWNAWMPGSENRVAASGQGVPNHRS
jgi:hypothetical protein